MLSNKVRMAQNSFVFAADISFHPEIFSGFTLWLKANAIEGLSDGDPITTWVDFSGNGNDATQATANLKPLYKTNIINGLPAVLFDSTDDMMDIGGLSFANNTNFSIFIVYNVLDNFPGSHRTLEGTGNNWLMGPHQSIHRHYNGDFIEGPASDANFVYMTLVNTSGIGATLRVNGVTSGSNANTIGPGGIDISSSSEPANGYVPEILAYSSAFSGSNISLMEGYLTSKYAL